MFQSKALLVFEAVNLYLILQLHSYWWLQCQPVQCHSDRLCILHVYHLDGAGQLGSREQFVFSLHSTGLPKIECFAALGFWLAQHWVGLLACCFQSQRHEGPLQKTNLLLMMTQGFCNNAISVIVTNAMHKSFAIRPSYSVRTEHEVTYSNWPSSTKLNEVSYTEQLAHRKL